MSARPDDLVPPQRRWRHDLLALAALCAVVFGLGLTTHGVTNWQEAQRLVVAREMQARGDWLLPTINGEPYLAKPPMIYWCQLLSASVRGAEVQLFDLRLTVAVAGLLGVLATYVCARVLLRGTAPEPRFGRAEPERWSRDAAWLSGLFLAGGVLYVRSSRIGELDILLVPLVVTAIAAIGIAWRRHLREAKTEQVAIGIAVVAAIGAALTKGPPALLVVAAGGYGGIALYHALSDRHVDTRFLAFGKSDAEPGQASGPLRWLLGVSAALATAAATARTASDASGWIGSVVLGLGAGATVFAFAGLATRARAAALLASYSRTHPVAVLGLPALALWGWARLAAARTPGGSGAAFLEGELEDNLNLLLPEAPLNNLEAAAYGVGAGSVFAIVALVWVVKDRPRIHAAWYLVLGWTLLSLLAFSMLGKGVARYLTPVWPGMAILAGMVAASALRDARRPRSARTVLVAMLVLLALGQGLWYAYGRERFFAHRSPRDLVTELRSLNHDGRPLVDPARIATMDFYIPAVDYYAGHPVRPIGFASNREEMMGQAPWTLDTLREDIVAADQPMLVLIRLEPRADSGEAEAIERLAQAGLIVQTLPTRSRFTIENGRVEVGAVLVDVPRAG